MNEKQNLLVLCTGNSCRSQMAEGYFRHFAGDRFHVFSAGTEPKEEVHPLAIQVMGEDGIDLANQSPKHLQDFLGHLAVRYLIMCAVTPMKAARASGPVWANGCTGRSTILLALWERSKRRSLSFVEFATKSKNKSQPG